MTVTQLVGSLGSWELTLDDATRKDIVDAIDYFGHIVIVPGQVDVEASGQSLLKTARYVGVLRGKSQDARNLAGSGMLFWLGDEDDKGYVLETQVDLVSKTLLQAVTAVKPPSVTLGTVYPQTDPAARYTGQHVFQSPRKALDTIAAAFGAEIRVNGDGTLDVGTQAQLYATAPRQDGQATPIVTRSAGSDIDLLGVPGDPAVEEGAYDYTTDVVIVGQTTGDGTTPDTQFAVGRRTAASIPYFDILGNPVKFTRMISQSSETTGSVDATATLELNRFNRLTRSLNLQAGEYEAVGDFVVGDQALVYDPTTGIQDFGRELMHQGERIWPDVVRVSGMTWPVTRGHTVAFRTGTGVWLDLTPYVTWETSGTELVVGDLPKSLTRPSDPLQDRVDAARANQPDTTIPNPPSITLSTYSLLDARGNNAARIRVAITPPTTNTDGSVPVGVAYYVVRWATLASTDWSYTYAPTTVIDVEALLDLDYKVQAAASDGVNQSAWSTQQTIRSSVDTTAPPAPADPVLTSRLGQLRIEYIGVAADGQPMPKDTNRIEMHVGDTVGFTATVSTRVSSVNPFARSTHPYDLPYGITKYVRLLAVDHTGNVSSASATVAGSTAQLQNGDIAALDVGKLTSGSIFADIVNAGRFTTALFGARVELNSVGLQIFDATEAMLVNLDGVNNLITGILQTSLTGRRILIATGNDIFGGSNTGGQIAFIAPDGTTAVLTGFTAGGSEGFYMGIPVGAVPSWNGFQVQESLAVLGISRTVNLIFGAGGTAGSGGFLVESTTSSNVTTAGARKSRYQIDPTNHIWWPSNGTNRRLQLVPVTNSSQNSPALVWVNEANLGAGIQYNSSTGSVVITPGNGTVSNASSLQAVLPDSSATTNFMAAAFLTPSDERLKEDIVTATGLLEELRAKVRPVHYRMKKPARAKADKGIESLIAVDPEDRPRFGLVAQEMPGVMQSAVGDVLVVDHAAGIAFALGATRELAELVLPELEAVRAELAALTGGKK